MQTGYYLACLDLGVSPEYNVAERERVRHYKIGADVRVRRICESNITRVLCVTNKPSSVFLSKYLHPIKTIQANEDETWPMNSHASVPQRARI